MPHGAQLRNIFDHYASRFPAWARWRRASCWRATEQFSEIGDPVSEGDEVAFLPPVSGGTAAAELAYIARDQDPAGHFFALTRRTVDTRALSPRLVARRRRSGGDVRRRGAQQQQGPPHAVSGLRMLRADGHPDARRNRPRNRRLARHRPHRHGAPAGPHGDRRNQRRRDRHGAAPPGRRSMRRWKASTGSSGWSPSGKRSTSWTARSGWKESGTECAGCDSILSFVVLAPRSPRSAQQTPTSASMSTWCASSPPSRTPRASWWRTLKDDFTILDNGVQQEIAVFERHTEQPLSVALLIDTSGSTADGPELRSRFGRHSCTRCSAEGNPEDAVALYSFNYGCDQAHHFTRNASSHRAFSAPAAWRGRNFALRRDLSRVARPGRPRRRGAHGDRHRRRRYHQHQGLSRRA